MFFFLARETRAALSSELLRPRKPGRSFSGLALDWPVILKLGLHTQIKERTVGLGLHGPHFNFDRKTVRLGFRYSHNQRLEVIYQQERQTALPRVNKHCLRQFHYFLHKMSRLNMIVQFLFLPFFLLFQSAVSHRLQADHSFNVADHNDV